MRLFLLFLLYIFIGVFGLLMELFKPPTARPVYFLMRNTTLIVLSVICWPIFLIINFVLNIANRKIRQEMREHAKKCLEEQGLSGNDLKRGMKEMKRQGMY